jgi:hypothetical protein
LGHALAHGADQSIELERVEPLDATGLDTGQTQQISEQALDAPHRFGDASDEPPGLFGFVQRAFEQTKQIELRDHLPLSWLGKPSKRALLAEELRRLNAAPANGGGGEDGAALAEPAPAT